MALPTSGLTLHVDASTSAKLYKVFVSGGPHTGTPVDGESVYVWDSVEGANRLFKQWGGLGVPVWRATTPLMLLPCLDIAPTGQRLEVANNAGTPRPLSELISASEFTLLVAFYADTITNTSNSYDAHPLICDNVSSRWGTFLSLVGGVPKVLAYNEGGGAHYVRLDCTAGASHVLMVRHTGGVLYASLDGGAESSVASGNTTSDLSQACHLGYSNSGTVYDGRIGEVAIYNIGLTGTALTDATSYFTAKWLGLTPPSTAVEHAYTFVGMPV